MHLDIIPKVKETTPEDKGYWVVYQFMRYRDRHKSFLMIKFLLDFLFVFVVAPYIGLWSILAGVVWMQLTNHLYDVITWEYFSPFYKEFSEFVFQKESNHDTVLLLNRVENYLKTNEAKHKNDLKECFEALDKKYHKN